MLKMQNIPCSQAETGKLTLHHDTRRPAPYTAQEQPATRQIDRALIRIGRNNARSFRDMAAESKYRDNLRG